MYGAGAPQGLYAKGCGAIHGLHSGAATRGIIGIVESQMMYTENIIEDEKF